jgi:Tfp pilus assembly protein FimT
LEVAGGATGGEARPTAARAQGQAGTTLIETLVVVAITALVALIGLPQMQQGLLTLSQRQAVAVVAARLRLARGEALRTDAPVVFAVAPDGAAYGVVGRVATPTPPGVTVRIPQGTAAANGRIVFYGDGSATGGVVAVSAGRRTLRVVVSPGAGAVEVRRA